MKIALAQIDTTVGDFAGNISLILKYAQSACELGADLVVFPELALCGYPPRDLVEKLSFVERSQNELLRLARHLPPIPTLVGYVRRSRANHGKQVANAAAWLEGGKVVADYAKILLPFYDVFDESRYFEPGASVCVHDFGGYPRGHYDLRRHLERQAFLGQSPLHARPGGGMRGGGRQPAAEHRLLALQHRKNPTSL